jgi:ammonia channel protein AmtB
MIHEKTLESIATGIVAGIILIPAACAAVPLTYYVIKDIAKLYFKKEEKLNYQEKNAENQKNLSGF